MIKSMTGFASLTRDLETAAISVTIRAVNHRFLDVQLRVPSSLAVVESRLRTLVQQRIARGRIEVSISVQSRRQAAVEVEVNDTILEGLAAALERARDRGLVAGPLAPGDVLLLYTDGWLEAGSRESHRSHEQLAELVAGGAEGPLEQLTGALRRDAVARGGGSLRDDMVVFAVRPRP
jgi:uncharacterized protein (TIGR00255 family)